MLLVEKRLVRSVRLQKDGQSAGDWARGFILVCKMQKPHSARFSVAATLAERLVYHFLSGLPSISGLVDS